jgi:putative FmdB family regulatory protein
MPTYEYKCRVCNDVLNVAHMINDKPTVICGKCGNDRIKAFSPPALSFPGSGWGSDK